MPGYFLDTSALAKFYHAEAGSARVEELGQAPDSRLIISQLSLIEIQSVFAMKVRTGAIPEAALDRLLGRFYADLADGRFQVYLLGSRHWTLAGVLVREHAVRHGLRTLDSIQLAMAIELHRIGAASTLIASDRILCKVAAVRGLSVLDPLTTAE